MSENKIPRIKVKNKKSGTWDDVLPIAMQPYNDGDLKDSIKKLEGKIVIDEKGQDPVDTDAEVYFDLNGNNEYSGILVPEAPQDGKAYIRKNGSWYEYPGADIIDTKVTKVPGKDLSTNDYTDAEKSKLASLQYGVFVGDNLPTDPNIEMYVDLNGELDFNGSVIPEAPIDGNVYVRKDGAWYSEKLVLDGKLDTSVYTEDKKTFATKTELNNKQNTLISGTNIKTINGDPILGEGDLVVSVDGKLDTSVYLEDKKTFATKTELGNKQDTLVSGTNIKTINGDPILGEGDLVLAVDVPTQLSQLSEDSTHRLVTDDEKNKWNKYDAEIKENARVTAGALTDLKQQIIDLTNKLNNIDGGNS